MPVPIAELFVAIGADISGAVSGLNQLDSRLKGLSGAISKATPAARALTVAGAGITATFVDAIRVGSDFENQMSAVRAQLNPAEMQQFNGAVRDLARDLGKTTKFSAKEAAQGIEELLKLGVPAEDVLGGAAKAALELAVATGTNVANAGAIAASAMNAFGLSTAELPDVVQALAGVSSRTAADMDDIRLGLSDTGASAAQLGLSFRDTVTALGIFRDGALTGNTAGTALKTMLVGLQPVTDREKKLFEELGITVGGTNNAFFDAQGRIKSLSAVAGVLRSKFGHLTRQQRALTFQMIFGTQGMQAANLLFDQGSQGVSEYAKEIASIDPAEQARRRMDNLRGDLEKLRSAFQDVQIEIHDMVQGPLRALVQGLIATLDKFGEWTPEMKRFAAQVAFATGALATMVGGFVLLAPFIASIPVAFGVLSGALGIVAVGLAGLAIAAKALKIAWDNNMFGIQQTTAEVFGAMPEFFGRVRHQIIFLNTVLDNTILATLQKLEVFINTTFNPAMDALAAKFDAVKLAAQPIADTLEALRARIQPILEGLLGGAGGFDPSAILGGIGEAFGALGSDAVTLDTFKTSITGIGAAMTLLGVGGPVGAAIIAILSIAGAFLTAYQHNEKFRESIDLLRQQLVPLEEELTRAFAPLIQFGRTEAPGVQSAFQNLGNVLGTAFTQQLQSAQPFADSVGNLFNALGRFFRAVGALNVEVFKKIFDQVLIPALEQMERSLKTLNPLLDAFKQVVLVFPSLGEQLKPATDALNFLAGAIDAVSAALEAAEGNIPDWLIQLLGQQFLGPFGQFAQPGLAPGSDAHPDFGQPIGPFAPQPSGGDVNIGTVNISSEVDADNFIRRMADVISGSATRAEPPVESQTPGLVPQPVTP